MESTDPRLDVEDKNATNYVDDEIKDAEKIPATNDPPKVKPRRVNPRQIRSQPKIGRNEPCPCGSGMKYKKCHLMKQQQELQKQLEMRRKIDEFTQKSSKTEVEEAEVSQKSD